MVNNLLIPWTGTRLLDTSGDPIAGAKVYIYLEDTTTLASIYTDRDLTSAAANPIIADSGGQVAPRYIGEVPYKIKVTTSSDVTVFEYDDLPGALAVSSGSGSYALPNTPFTTKTEDYTIVSGDMGTIFNGNSGSNDVTFTLPDATTLTNGRRVMIRHVGSANNVIVSPTGGQTIDGSASDLTMTGRYDWRELGTDGANWHLLNAAPFPAGTVMLFVQSTAPTGWTKSTTHNNKALRIVSGSVSTGGSDSFTSVFGVSKTTGSHTLTTAEIPSHTHSYNRVQGGSAGTYGGGNIEQNVIGSTTGSAGGGGGHTHPMTLDLQYVDAIIATKG